MDFRYDSCCGLFCGACPIMKANEQGRVDDLAQKLDAEAKDLTCHGCKSGVGSAYCTNCEIKDCARRVGVEYCFQCEKYPCLRLKGKRIDPCAHHTVMMRNLNHLRRVGRPRWLLEQQTRWTCRACGTRYTWYEKKCEHCGTKVLDCRAEEAAYIEEQ